MIASLWSPIHSIRQTQSKASPASEPWCFNSVLCVTKLQSACDHQFLSATIRGKGQRPPALKFFFRVAPRYHKIFFEIICNCSRIMNQFDDFNETSVPASTCSSHVHCPFKVICIKYLYNRLSKNELNQTRTRLYSLLVFINLLNSKDWKILVLKTTCPSQLSQYKFRGF